MLLARLVSLPAASQSTSLAGASAAGKGGGRAAGQPKPRTLFLGPGPSADTLVAGADRRAWTQVIKRQRVAGPPEGPPTRRTSSRLFPEEPGDTQRTTIFWFFYVYLKTSGLVSSGNMLDMFGHLKVR